MLAGENGYMQEGLNKKIKDVKRLAFGAHSFENFRKRALLYCCDISISEEPYRLREEKNSLPFGFNEKEASNA